MTAMKRWSSGDGVSAGGLSFDAGYVARVGEHHMETCIFWAFMMRGGGMPEEHVPQHMLYSCVLEGLI